MNRSGDFNFDAVAERYDSWYEQPVGRLYDRMEKDLIEKMLPGRFAGTRLLEVGCGTGHWSEFFAGRGYEVTGVDVSEPMLARARTRGIPRADFRVADAHRLPFPDGAFDLSVAVTVLEFVSDVAGVLSEMARCVRTGGYILVGVLNYWSPINLYCRFSEPSTVGVAHLFTSRRLRGLLQGYGRTQMLSGACFLPWTWALGLADVFDFLSRRLNLGLGAFLLAQTRKNAK